MSEPNKREDAIAQDVVRATIVDRTRVGKALASYRAELLAPFEALANKWEACGRNPESAPATYSGGVQATWTVAARMLRDAIRRANGGE